MASKTDLANYALTKIGKGRLTDIALDGTEESIVAGLLFDEVRDEILDQGPWSFAIKRAALAGTADVAVYGNAYAFALPGDFIRVLDIDSEGSTFVDTLPDTFYSYNIEGQLLWADSSVVNIRYISKVVDTTLWVPSFKKAFVLKLAAEMAYTLKGDKSLVQMLMQEYEAALARGLAVDGQEGSPEQILTTDLLEVR